MARRGAAASHGRTEAGGRCDPVANGPRRGRPQCWGVLWPAPTGTVGVPAHIQERVGPPRLGRMTFLVTGGAGYIGSHVVRLLRQAGTDVVIVDDLSTGDTGRNPGTDIVELDVAAPGAHEVLARELTDRSVEAVIHFAARKQVGESVERPEWYYQQNIGGLANLLTAMREADARLLIFSSSAAVYGMPDLDLVPESTPCHPINPYGETKYIGEWMLANAEAAWGLRWTALRYFNVAGAGAPDLGDRAVLNLVPMVLDRLARGDRPRIFGDDYPTPDGTCVRDYIHVADLADAHIAAARALQGDAPLREHVFNVGTGTGSSVRDVVDAIGAVSGLDSTAIVEPRRAGDPARIVGDPSRIGEVLGWRARYDLADIVRSAWDAWQAGPRRISR